MRSAARGEHRFEFQLKLRVRLATVVCTIYEGAGHSRLLGT